MGAERERLFGKKAKIMTKPDGNGYNILVKCNIFALYRQLF